MIGLRRVAARTRRKLRYSRPARLLVDGLLKVRLRVVPFYLIQEGLFRVPASERSALPGDYELGFLSEDEALDTADMPERWQIRAMVAERLREGSRCFGVRHHGKVVAFSWVDPRRVMFGTILHALDRHEAYLCDAYTLPSYRGRGIAPFMRYRMYEHLAGEGVRTLYSVSNYCNVSAIRFKQKLNARFLELRAYCRLFRRWKANVLIKRYARPCAA
jgi:ribosomal protein S18 acetylase RimI-like enzyme